MKKLFISMFALSALAACSKSEEPQVTNPDNALVPIVLNAGIETSSETKAPIEGNKFAQGSDVFRVTAYGGTAAPTDWTASAFQEAVVNCTDAAGTIAFSPARIYPIDGSKLYFYAYTTPGAGTYTSGSGATAPTVEYTITGQEDIMFAKDETGFNKNTVAPAGPAFGFSHLLKKVSFKVMKDVGLNDATINVTKIEIADANTKAVMDVSNGSLTFSTPGTLKVFEGTEEVSVSPMKVGADVMFQEGTTFNINVTTDKDTYTNVPISITDGAAAKSHTVTLTFKGTQIAATASITPWDQNGGTGGTELN